ncbi:MAG: hypothetical protein INR71_14495 [Terriglobus roseus]|nr:hypothetical protein [Terriglobus roseus]
MAALLQEVTQSRALAACKQASSKPDRRAGDLRHTVQAPSGGNPEETSTTGGEANVPAVGTSGHAPAYMPSLPVRYKTADGMRPSDRSSRYADAPHTPSGARYSSLT